MFQVIMLGIITALFWGTAPIFDKAALRTATPFAGIAVRSLAMGVFTVALLAFAGLRLELTAVTGTEVMLFSTSALLAGCVGTLVYFHALKIGDSSIVVPIFTGLYLLIAAVWGVLFLKEPLSVAKVAGAAMIVAGIALIRL